MPKKMQRIAKTMRKLKSATSRLVHDIAGFNFVIVVVEAVDMVVCDRVDVTCRGIVNGTMSEGPDKRLLIGSQ